MLSAGYSRRLFTVLHLVLLALVVADRWFLLSQFTFQFVDDDQSIMWYGAKEFASGNFHEPCFYGQNYNTMAESLLSVPLIWMGISYPVAVTVMMSLMTLLPFIILSALMRKKELYFQSLLILAIPVFLPVEYGMITAISRGLITGILFASIGTFFLFTERKSKFFFFGLFGMLGLYSNPSSIILLFPIGVWQLIEHFKSQRFYIGLITGAIPGGLIWLASLYFYKQHPEYVVHPSNSFDGSLKIIKPYEWDKFFDYVMPVLWGMGWFLLPIILIFCFVFYRQREKSIAMGLLAGAVLIFFALTRFKVHHGFPTVFLSWARMFLAIPVLFAIIAARLKYPPVFQKLSPLLVIVALIFFTIKCTRTSDIVNREIYEKTEHAMYVEKISVLQNLCDTISEVAKLHNAELIAVGTDWTKHIINYGCPCLKKGMPRIIEPELDRRTWLLDDESGRIRKKILFVGFFPGHVPDQLIGNPNVQQVHDNPLMFLLIENSLTTEQVLQEVDMPMRDH